MSLLIRRSHNVSVLLYHFVCPANYQRVVLTQEVDNVLNAVCHEIAERYQIEFLEIGADADHVHFLIQAVPSNSPTKIITMIKSLPAREIFQRVPSVKKALWGGEFWTDGYYVATVGQHGTEEVIKRYMQEQGRDPNEYDRLHVQQLSLF